jgi:hypothetical protein
MSSLLSTSIEGCPSGESQGLSGGHPQSSWLSSALEGVANDQTSAHEVGSLDQAKGTLPLLQGTARGRTGDGGSQGAAMPARANLSRKYRRGMPTLQRSQGLDALLQVSQVDSPRTSSRRQRADCFDLGIASHLGSRASRVQQHTVGCGIEFSSGDGLGNHQPGSMTCGFAIMRQPASGRARDRARCPAVARSDLRRAE